MSLEDFGAMDFRSKKRSKATIRGVQNAIGFFCDYVTDVRYDWPTALGAQGIGNCALKTSEFLFRSESAPYQQLMSETADVSQVMSALSRSLRVKATFASPASRQHFACRTQRVFEDGADSCPTRLHGSPRMSDLESFHN
jgi:hypothetical protein